MHSKALVFFCMWAISEGKFITSSVPIQSRYNLYVLSSSE